MPSEEPNRKSWLKWYRRAAEQGDPDAQRDLGMRYLVGDDDTETIYLYNDGSVPVHSTANMNSYLKKLAVLAKLSAKT